MNHILRIIAATCLSWLATGACASANDGEFDPCTTIRVTAEQLVEHHVSQNALNDELSRKWLRMFLSRLDPSRMYFLASDVAEFQQYEDSLDDLAKEGDFRFPALVRDRYRERVAQAVVHAADALSLTHDYSQDEEYTIRLKTYARDSSQLRERWRLRMKFELLVEKRHGSELPRVQSQLAGRYRRILRQADQMSDERLCQIYLDSLAASFDPHSAYWSPARLRTLSQTITVYKYTLGIGVRQDAGDYIITGLHPSLRSAAKPVELLGWHLLAVRRLDGSIFDLTELHPYDFAGMVTSPFGDLQTDNTIILELMNPMTFTRVTMSWPRFRQ